jgi:hypothetical protein
VFQGLQIEREKQEVKRCHTCTHSFINHTHTTTPIQEKTRAQQLIRNNSYHVPADQVVDN